jgi:flagellin
MDDIDAAISGLNAVRADLGATTNRFQSTIRNLTSISENVTAARSQIRDTDFAKETSELTRNQIIQQASTTILSQANQRPQAALQLLG